MKVNKHLSSRRAIWTSGFGRLPLGGWCFLLILLGGCGPVPATPGDGNQATKAELDNPGGVVAGPDGSLLIADSGSGRVRAVTG